MELLISLNSLLNSELEKVLNSFDYKQYEKFINKQNREKLSLMKRKVVASLPSGVCFGDLALDGVARGRAASIRACSEAKIRW